MPTDEQLYSRFIHGETEALDELLFGIGRNLARKHARKSHYDNEQALNALPDSYMELIEESDLLSDIVKIEDNKRLYIALNSIPEEYARRYICSILKNLV